MADTKSAMLQTPTALADWLIIAPMLAPLVGAALATVLPRLRVAIAALAIISALAAAIALGLRVMVSGPASMTMGNWLPPFGISFTADIAGAALAALAAAIALLVLIYAAGERTATPDDRFAAMLLLLVAGVNGSFLTGDLFNLYVWFEVMLIASFGLLSQDGKPAQLDGAIKYGLLNVLATLMLLLSLGLLYGLTGTLNMADIARSAGHANVAALIGVVSLLLLAFAMKSAVFPVNAWLPASYHTPPAAISALFAGLLTKVGVFALLRTTVSLLPGLHGAFGPVLTVVAVSTLVIAPLGAIAETNLRRALAFLVIGGIGSVIAGMALASPTGVAGAGLYIVHSMLTMTGLFLVAGLVEAVTGATDSRQMGGVYAANGLVSGLFLLLVLGAAGVPPLLGFWPKLLLLQAALDGVQGGLDWQHIAIAVALLGNAVLTLIAGSRLWAHIFWRAGPEGAASEHAISTVMPLSERATRMALWPTLALVMLITIAGLAPNGLLVTARAAAAQMLNQASYIKATQLAEVRP